MQANIESEIWLWGLRVLKIEILSRLHEINILCLWSIWVNKITDLKQVVADSTLFIAQVYA